MECKHLQDGLLEEERVHTTIMLDYHQHRAWEVLSSADVLRPIGESVWHTWAQSLLRDTSYRPCLRRNSAFHVQLLFEPCQHLLPQAFKILCTRYIYAKWLFTHRDRSKRFSSSSCNRIMQIVRFVSNDYFRSTCTFDFSQRIRTYIIFTVSVSGILKVLWGNDAFSYNYPAHMQSDPSLSTCHFDSQFFFIIFKVSSMYGVTLLTGGAFFIQQNAHACIWCMYP